MADSKSRQETPIRLDMTNHCLWHGRRRIALRPKDCAVLQALAGQPGQTVEKAALLDAGWPEVYVSEGVLKDGIYRLRQALKDQGRRPRFIETVSRRQEAGLWELRSAISLDRLRHGDDAQRCRLLAEIYDRFTEGFATLDLQQAKVQLGQRT